jgi:hypothetical protein
VPASTGAVGECSIARWVRILSSGVSPDATDGYRQDGRGAAVAAPGAGAYFSGVTLPLPARLSLICGLPA